jgi:hypothetical protein
VTQFVHVHSSGRFDRPVEALIRDVNLFHTFASIVTHTEMGADVREKVWRNKYPGWDYWRSPADNGADDVVIEWKTADWKMIGPPRAIQMSDMTYFRTSGKRTPPFFIVQVRLQSKHNSAVIVRVQAVHMPTRNTSLRRRVWQDVINNWSLYLKSQQRRAPGRYTIATGDWNADYRKYGDRILLWRAFAPRRLKAAWLGHVPATGGTHGPRRLIDGDYSDLPIVGCKLLKDTPSSDHRPYAVTYRLPAGKRK